MARLPRLSVAGYPHHVVQRGNNRQSIFSSNADFEMLLDLLGQFARKFDVAIHAYVLMTNHFHLLLTPQSETGLPQLMQALGRSYVRYFNDTHQRTGTLWEGRYKSTCIQAERYFLACMTYIDLNPVRAGMVEQALSYPWSSHGHYAGQRKDKLITPHALIWELGNTPFAREAAYAEMVGSGIAQQQQDELTHSVLSGWALGETDFVAELQNRTQRRVAKLPAGRPFLAKKPVAS